MAAKKVAVVSASGFLGAKVAETFAARGHSVVPTFFSGRGEGTELDVTKASAVKEFVEAHSLDVVVNCSAITAVDWCDSHRKECFAVNVKGAENLAAACLAGKAKLVHFSTGFVFDGKKGKPYTEDDLLNPLNAYSESKAESEKAVTESMDDFLVIRTIDLYGFSPGNEKNFVAWVLENLKKGEQFSVVEDQLSQPALVDDVALAAARLVELGQRGIFHVFGPDYLSKHSFALKIAEAFGFDKSLIKPISTADSPLKAKRPMTLPVSSKKAESLGIKPRGIEEGLLAMKKQMQAHKQTNRNQ